jgi:soluble lytic murein transglycosylase-like protein
MIALGLILGAVFLSFQALGSEAMSEKPLIDNVPERFTKFDDLFKKYAKKYGLSWLMLRRISWIESRVNTDPRTIKGEVSFDGKSWGIMQVAPNTGSLKEREIKGNPTPAQLNNPEFSIDLGAKLLAYLSDKYSSERDIVMAYNQGEKNQDRLIQLEKQGQLLASQYPQARDYWNKYQLAMENVG